MTPLDAEHALLSFLSEKKERKGRAILLTGPWGSGKTYLWKNCIDPKLVRHKIYVSAFGAEGPAGLKARLLTQFLLGIGKRTDLLRSEKAITFGKKLTQWMGRTGKAMATFLNSAGGALLKRAEIDPLEFAEFIDEQSIICIDDIERTSTNFKIEDLLAISNLLTEHKNLDVILICNEEQIGSGDEDARQRYLKFKEKSVNCDVKLNVSIAETFERILEFSIRTTSAKELACSHKDIIVDTFSRAAKQNLRSLERIFTTIELLNTRYNGTLSNTQVRLLCSLTIALTRGELEPPEFYAFDAFSHRLGFSIKKNNNQTIEEDKRIKFLNLYFGNEGYLFDSGIYQLVSDGDVDIEHFIKTNMPLPDLSISDRLFEEVTSGNWRYFSDNKLQELIDSLCDLLIGKPEINALKMLECLGFARFLAQIVSAKLPSDLGKIVLDHIRERFKLGEELADEDHQDTKAWQIHMGEIADLVESEFQEFIKEKDQQRQCLIRTNIESAMSNTDRQALQQLLKAEFPLTETILCESNNLNLLFSKHSTHPKFFIDAIRMLLDDMRPRIHMNKDFSEYIAEIERRLKRISGDEQSERMDKWRANLLLTP